MPTVDSELPGLRIGGWIPHHEATADARPGPRPAGHFRSVPSAPVGLTPPRSHTVGIGGNGSASAAFASACSESVAAK